MRSLIKLKKETKLNKNELLIAMFECIHYYLSEEELEPFLIEKIEKRINKKYYKK